MDVVTYALCKKYVEDTVIGLGALKGAPCTIKSIVESQDHSTITVTFEWTSDTTPPVKQTSEMVVKQGTVTKVTPILNTGTKIAEIEVDGVKKDIYAPNGGGGGSAELQDDLTASVTVGGINAGKNFPKDTPLETVLRDMLDPVLYPTFTNPSATLSATGAKLLEKGATLATTFTVAFNRGSITPAYGTSGYRSGPATTYSLNGGTAQAGNTFNVTVSESTTQYQATVAYSAGEQPKDSTGHDYSSPLPAGSVTSGKVNYEFVEATWANTTSASSITKQSLVSKSTKVKEFNFPDTTDVNPEVFDVASSWTVTAVESYNTLSGQWEDASSQFAVTTTSHDDAAGNPISYARYTCSLGFDLGARKVRVKWS